MPLARDRSRRELVIVSVAAVLLVLLRCLVATIYEGFNFDSDQAIVGLMAKHVSAFKAFPIYYYGQNYLLAVQAWIIAPFFWLFQPSVAVMRVPLVGLNILVAVWLLRALVRHVSLRPATAFVAALPFVAAGPAAATTLLWLGGGSIEPLVYVLALWALRHRPFAFGLLLAIGFQHREWTIFAAPGLVVAEAATGELWSWNTLRRAGWMALGFSAAWLVVDDVRMHLTGETATLQAASLRNNLCFDAQWRDRVAELVGQVLPSLYNGARIPPFSLTMNTAVATGHPLVGGIVAVTLLLMAVRLPWTWRQSGPKPPGSGFGVYLASVGAFAACAYPLSCTVGVGGVPLLRYVLYALLLPVGLCATFIRCEPSRALRRLVIAVFVVWGGANLGDTTRVLASAVRTPPESEHRVLTGYLLSHQIHYARAKYWDAYVMDFLSRERVVVASFDTIRIPEYQKEVDAHADVAVSLVRQPCQGFATVASWCLQR